MFLYFNPHHREGGDTKREIIKWLEGISIHTTAKVVTYRWYLKQNKQDISIHTTAKVVTIILVDSREKSNISIHTTAKVVTVLCAWKLPD